ncbi:RidA family protein [Streptomyces botrytidirepellens]|uniref:RidA family protein n=1 Tax=Streptomyces botrytidirepellens TaxID=2486417 RepID=A0A3M8WZV1_9ACTN|nr:RidA family protein [Streptomyces botrytidirepellens]RNG34944.1 RidA family protein [Streptomyces botrytidirepellens]
MNHTATPTAIVPASRTKTVGPFSPGVSIGPLLQVAGQVGVAPTAPDASAPAPVASVRTQTLQALDNVREVLTEGRTDWEDVLMIRVYLTDTSHLEEFNDTYREYFSGHGCETLPARTTVYVGLPAGLLVEIDALAVHGDH